MLNGGVIGLVVGGVGTAIVVHNTCKPGLTSCDGMWLYGALVGGVVGGIVGMVVGVMIPDAAPTGDPSAPR